MIAAPTGKAAKRAAEVTGAATGTVHRILGATRIAGRWGFTYNESNPLPHDVVIVDEASMLDTSLAASLLRAVDSERTSVFFVGDAHQLPSVGPGQVFYDLIRSRRIPVVRLTEVHRAAQESWVCRVAPGILEGKIDLARCDDFLFVERSDPEAIRRQVVELVTQTMPGKGIDDVLVLSPQNGGAIGIEAFNTDIQQITNPPVTRPRKRGETESDYEMLLREVSSFGSKGTRYAIRAGDRVIQKSNDYQLMVFNGEVGDVIGVDDKYQVHVRYDQTREVIYPTGYENQLRLAYALTVHSAQGSQADWVVVICHSAHHYMWSRQLLYTAVTRAKKGVVIVGDRAGIETALANNDPRRRQTYLRERLL